MSATRIPRRAGRGGVPEPLRFCGTAGVPPAGRAAAGCRRYGEDAEDRPALTGVDGRPGPPPEGGAGVLGARRRARARQMAGAGPRERVVARTERAERRAAEPAGCTLFPRRAVEHPDAPPHRENRCGPRRAFPGRVRPPA
ncbi:hypothetical protein [Streptomyces diastaticus]